MDEQRAWNAAIAVPVGRWQGSWLARPDVRYAAVHLVLVPLAVGVCALLLQYSRLDLALATFVSDGSTHTFVWRRSLWLDVLGHQSARGLPILVGAIATLAGLTGLVVRRLRPWRSLLLSIGAAMAAGPLLIAILKTMTTLHCPADLLQFGGIVDYGLDQAGPFWASSRHDAGHCSPSGHAGGGYAFLSLYFAGWAAGRPAWRWAGLAIGIGAGLLFSVVRIMQGAHFASATLWAAAVDWEVSALIFLPLLRRPTGPPQ